LSRAERDGDTGNQATRAPTKFEGGKSFTARLCRLLFYVTQDDILRYQIAADETLRAEAKRSASSKGDEHR
jgi:hypothetical protein